MNSQGKSPISYSHVEQEVMERRYHLPYNWIPQEFSRKWRSKAGLWEIAGSLAGELKGKRVLDIGCGDGWYTARMVRAGAEVTGVDYSERAVGFARIIVPQAEFIAAHIAELPFADGYFDIIFLIQVLEHIPPGELTEAVKEMARVLKPSGCLIVSVPSVRRAKSAAHFQHFTPQALEKVLALYFSTEKTLGQEKHSAMLHLLERICENRFWFSSPLARIINLTLFMRLWNRVSSKVGQNLVAKCTKHAV